MNKPLIIMLFLLGGTVVAQQLAWQAEPDPAPPAAGAAQHEDGETGEPDAGNPDNAAEGEGIEAVIAEDVEAGGGDSDIPEVDESELTTEIEDEFEPTEEISEDYPVPLPSDI